MLPEIGRYSYISSNESLKNNQAVWAEGSLHAHELFHSMALYLDAFYRPESAFFFFFWKVRSL